MPASRQSICSFALCQFRRIIYRKLLRYTKFFATPGALTFNLEIGSAQVCVHTYVHRR